MVKYLEESSPERYDLKFLVQRYTRMILNRNDTNEMIDDYTEFLNYIKKLDPDVASLDEYDDPDVLRKILTDKLNQFE